MGPVLDFVIRHGYWLLFASVITEQAGIPVPAAPVLLAMGALCGLGHFSWAASLGLGTLAAVMADQVWYWLGRLQGAKVLNFLCRISLEPDSCVSDTKRKFSRWGALSLLFAKFVPGLSTVAVPLSGLTHMRLAKFLIADTAGAAFWSGAYLGVGWLFRNQLEAAAGLLSRFGLWLGVLIGAVLALYLGWKYHKRRRFIRELRIARVDPDEILRMWEAGEEVAIIDLRRRLDLETEALKIRGAIWMEVEDLSSRQDEIPREKEVILYCS